MSLISAKVINAGLPGELSTQGLDRLPDIINKHHPDLLILCYAGQPNAKGYKMMAEHLAGILKETGAL